MLRIRARSLAATGALLATLVLLPSVVEGGISPGHRLPDSPERPVRAREIDILRLSADLRFDLRRERIEGTARILFTPLRTGLRSFELDAADLSIERVVLESNGSDEPLPHELTGRKLRITLPRAAGPGEENTVAITYSCRPRSGMYFQPAGAAGAAQAWNYGESGLHYAWLPLYNDTNDRFAVEFRITAEAPSIVLSNGRLERTIENKDGTRTFHWVQEEEIPNYLIALDVGEFAEVPLEPARVGSKQIPLSVWTTPGTESGVAFTFRETPRMVEFFSDRFGYPYAWEKYDQVTLREFEGAMETTTMVGFTETYQRQEGDPVDSGPDFALVFPTWTYEDTIAHELAHHWFGDLVTCRSLGSIWLNESFATYAHTVWNAHAHGEDDLTYQRWRYLNFYLDDIAATGEVRPLEHDHHDAPGDMYRESITYVKGAIVIHMLRHIVGDEDFYRTIGRYLRTNAFGEVESADLLAAFERTTGRDLSWFFDDWITGGGGHPSITAKSLWVPERHQVDLTLEQVQADQPFENLFRLPVDVTVTTARGSKTHTVWMEDWLTRVALPADDRPLAVEVDAGNWLVAAIHSDRSLEETIYLLENGDLAARLLAARQVATDFPRRPEGVAALVRTLEDRSRHWGLRQEAALDLGTTGRPDAVDALIAASEDPDRRIRRAVAVALGRAGGTVGAGTLRSLIETDTSEDVIGAAAVSLGRIHAADAARFLRRQLSRDSRWWNSIRLGALMGLAELEDPDLVSTFEQYTMPRYQRAVRLAAVDGWFRAVPEDPALAGLLRDMTRDRNGNVRADALDRLGRLHRRQDLDFLREYALEEPNPNLAQAARDAMAEIEAFTSGGKQDHLKLR